MDTAKLNKRALAMFFMLFSFAILPFSGLGLHEAVQHGLDRRLFIFMALHNIAAIVFTVSTVIHLKYNWKPIINYIKSKKDQLLKYRKEMLIAGSTMVILLLISILHVMHGH